MHLGTLRQSIVLQEFSEILGLGSRPGHFGSLFERIAACYSCKPIESTRRHFAMFVMLKISSTKMVMPAPGS